jgi:SAM-dependent methyltransferase
MNLLDLAPGTSLMAVAGKKPNATFIQSGAEPMPLPDQPFEFLTVGYALRHFADLEAAFREFHRVLKSGGKVLILEATRPQGKLGSWFFKLYFGQIYPFFSHLLTRSAKVEEMMVYFLDHGHLRASRAGPGHLRGSRIHRSETQGPRVGVQRMHGGQGLRRCEEQRFNFRRSQLIGEVSSGLPGSGRMKHRGQLRHRNEVFSKNCLLIANPAGSVPHQTWKDQRWAEGNAGQWLGKPWP